MDRGAWQATVHGVTKESETTEQLKNNNIPSQDPVLSQTVPRITWEKFVKLSLTIIVIH